MPLKHFLFLCVLLSAFFSSVKATELNELSVDQLAHLQQEKNILLVDIRTDLEWKKSGVIKGSRLLAFFDKNGRYDTQHWLNQLQGMKASSDQQIVLVCRSGNRSGKVGELLTKQLNMPNIHHLKGGIKAWRRSDKDLVNVCEPELPC